jgi:hypothetical protein
LEQSGKLTSAELAQLAGLSPSQLAQLLELTPSQLAKLTNLTPSELSQLTQLTLAGQLPQSVPGAFLGGALGGYGGYGEYGSPGTAAGSALQGMASAISAAGSYNLATSNAAINAAQAEKLALQNAYGCVNGYFDLRAGNRLARAAERGPNLTSEQLNRIAQESAPKPLTTQQVDPISGKIFWPDLLQDEKFQAQRETLQTAFEERANRGAMPLPELRKAREAAEAMLDALTDMIRDVPPSDYLPAKRFLQSVAYEANKPLGIYTSPSTARAGRGRELR